MTSLILNPGKITLDELGLIHAGVCQLSLPESARVNIRAAHALVKAAAEKGQGIAGATGSWESIRTRQPLDNGLFARSLQALLLPIEPDELHGVPRLPAALIVGGLNTLDLKVAGHALAEVGSRQRAGSLSALYDYVQTRLIEANLHNDPAALRESLELLGEIESAWYAIPNEQRQVPAMAVAG